MENILFNFLPTVIIIIFIIFWDKYMEKERIKRKEKEEKEKRRKYLEDLLEEMRYNNEISRDNWKEWKKFSDLAYKDAKSTKYLKDLPKEVKENISEGYSIITGLLDHNIEPLEGNVMEVYKIFEMKNTISNLEKYLKDLKENNI